MNPKNYKELLHDIKAFIFDVDGVLTDGMLHISENGQLLRTMNVKDGFALKHAVRKGYEICIISGGTNPAVKSRLNGLDITHVYLGAEDKMHYLEKISEETSISYEQMLYMGDDIPDIEVMKKVKLACCPQNAAPEVKAVSDYISHKNGGDGCVRDVIEQVLKVHKDWF
jgi:3-deoxy-D-manno-octulosonate 8-phosphate phosphatase (KDO 8-P phosphatase)